MANNSSTNHKDSRNSSDTDSSATIKRSRRSNYSLSPAVPPVDLLRFVEVSPLNSTVQPHPRSGHRAIATDSDLWIWGGYFPFRQDNQEPMFAELWRFNFALRRWTLEPTTGNGPDSTLASHSMCQHRNLVFVFGGTGYPFGHTVSNELFILDLKRRHWRRCQLQNQQPEPVYGASMIGHGDYLYILCGTNTIRYHSDVYEVHLPALKCTQIGQTFDELEDFTGGGRYRQEAHIYDNKIFLFGGGSNSGLSFSFKNLPVFDLTTRTWSFIHAHPDPAHNFPAPRKFHSVFPFGENQIIMFGGASFDQTANFHALASPHLWFFNFEKLKWTRAPSLSMLRPTYFHAAAVNEHGEIWTHGGVVREPPSQARETRITALYKMQTQVPYLRELCWNSFLNRLSDRTCLTKEPHLLAQLNIPAAFVERIH